MDEGSDFEELRRDLRELAERVGRLEAAQAQSSGRAALPPTPQDAAVPASPAAASVPLPDVLPAAVSVQPAPSFTRKHAQSIEQRIGSQIFNRVGILAVLFAMAWFLKLAFDRNWIGPSLRIATGLVIAAALVLWSERFRRTGFAAFSYTLKALGSGVAYLSLWASFSVYHLMPAPVAFLLMVAVTVTNALLAWRQESEVLAAYALLGGLVTPGLLSTGEDHEVFLFSYLILLALGAVLFVGLRSWQRLAIGAFAGTSVYFAAWFFEFYQPRQLMVTGAFVAMFYAVFSMAPFLVPRRPILPRPDKETSFGAVVSFLVAAPLATASVAAIEAYSLVFYHQFAWLRFWIALGFSAVSILLSRLALMQPRANFAGCKLSMTQEALGVFFLALAIWLRGTGYPVTLGWLAEALLVIAIASRRPRPGRRWLAAAIVLLCVGDLVMLEWSDPLRQPVQVFLNPHFATYVFALIVFAITIWLGIAARRRTAAEPPGLVSWSALAALATIAFNVVALSAIGFEVHHYWSCGARLSGSLCRVVDPHDQVYAHFTYSGWFMVYGAALMAAGFAARSAFVRWQALVLLTFAIGKVFLFDASQLSQGYRVMSFLGLGVVLLAISFAYQRNWLVLRRET